VSVISSFLAVAFVLLVVPFFFEVAFVDFFILLEVFLAGFSASLSLETSSFGFAAFDAFAFVAFVAFFALVGVTLPAGFSASSVAAHSLGLKWMARQDCIVLTVGENELDGIPHEKASAKFRLSLMLEVNASTS